MIQGWDDGLSGMCVGEKRKLTIPSDLGYGSAGSGSEIPGGSTLGEEQGLSCHETDAVGAAHGAVL